MKKLRYFSRFSVITLLFLASIYLLWSLFFNKVETVFNVSIDTEYIAFSTLDINNSRLILQEASVSDLSKTLFDKYEGSLELNQGVDVTIERISYGPIVLMINCRSCKSVGRLYNGETGDLETKLGRYSEVVIPYSEENSIFGETNLIRIDGIIDAGRSIGFEQIDESTAVLRGGEVDLLGLSNVYGNYFHANTIKVNTGDRLIFEGQDSKAYGFVIINEQPGMKAAYRVLADEMKIIRPGPRTAEGGQSFCATFLDGIYNDRFFKALSIAIGTLIFFISIFTFFMDVKQFQESPKSENHEKKNS